jgi:hypothetical protein
MIFGAVTLACLVAALALSMYGHHPLLMVPIAIACAVVFIRNGDGRSHVWTPAANEETTRSADRAELSDRDRVS